MPKVPQAHADARRQQILSAALACFAKQGVQRTTMQDICRKSALSPGAVYHYFKGKADIVDAVFRAHEGSITATATARLDVANDALLSLMTLRDAWFEGVGRGRLGERTLRLHAEVHAEAAHEPRVRAVLREHTERLLDTMQGAIERAQREGDIHPELDPEYVARVQLALLWGLRLQKLLDPEVSPARFHDTVMTMTAGGFGPTERS